MNNKFDRYSLLAAILLCVAVLGCETQPEGESGGTDQQQEPAAEVKPKETEESKRLDRDLKALIGSEQADAGDGQADSIDMQDPPPVEPLVQEGRAELTIELGDDWTLLSPNHEIWINTDLKQVLIGGKVCLTSGPLEMFICPKNTKEHESVMSANVFSQQVHAALLALGVEPGETATSQPQYRAAYGPEITIEMRWRDPKTKEVKTANATDWIRDFDTKQPMKAKWVFGGSVFYENPDTGEKQYLGDAGELVCLSNFSTATIDINVESSPDNASLLFEAATENIPEIGTQVYAVLKPGPVIGKPEKAAAPETTPEQQGGD